MTSEDLKALAVLLSIAIVLLERKETGMGLKVIQSPKFSEEELGLLVYLASKVLDRALATS